MKREYVLVFVAVVLMNFLFLTQAVELNDSEINNSTNNTNSNNTSNNTDGNSTTNATLENLRECKYLCNTIHKNVTRSCNIDYKNAAKICNDQRKQNILNCSSLSRRDRLQCRKDVQMQNKVCRKAATDSKKICLANGREERNICRQSCVVQGNNTSCQIYDNFSSELNTSKWSESGSLDEFGTNETLEVYHTAQLTAGDNDSSLIVNRTFSVNETIEYDVNYVNGSGNRRHTISLDSNNGDSWSLFGFWNSVEDAGVGNDLGNYHVKITFTDQGVNDEITLPNGTVTSTRPDGKLSSPGLEHVFGFVTSTGDNGTVEMNYDNVKICSA